nr:hypothetical protein [Arthrobacter sp. J3.40]
MNLTDLKDLFNLNLKGLPWISLLGSALGLSLVASLVFRIGHPSGSLLWLLEFLGIDASAGVNAVHAWFVAPVRKDVLTGALCISLVMVGASYAICHWKWLDSDERSWDVGRSHAARMNELRKRPTSGGNEVEEKRALLEREESSHSKEFRREWDLRSWYVGRMMRLASMAWLLTALNVEVNGPVFDLVVWGFAAAFVVVLLFINSVKTDSGNLFSDLGAVVFGLGVTLLATLMQLPIFIWSAMTEPHTPRRGEGSGEAGE